MFVLRNVAQFFLSVVLYADSYTLAEGIVWGNAIYNILRLAVHIRDYVEREFALQYYVFKVVAVVVVAVLHLLTHSLKENADSFFDVNFTLGK